MFALKDISFIVPLRYLIASTPRGNHFGIYTGPSVCAVGGNHSKMVVRW